MSEPRRFIFPFRVFPWTSLETSGGIPLKASNQERSYGYVPIYESLQAYNEAGFGEVPCGTFIESTRPTSPEVNE